MRRSESPATLERLAWMALTAVGVVGSLLSVDMSDPFTSWLSGFIACVGVIGWATSE